MVVELNKAEKYLLENLTKIAKEGSIDKNPRPKWKDGSDAHSIFINGVFETYDIANGETPITETRPIYVKKGINEIRWIYQYQTSDLDVLENELDIHWWNSWKVGDTNTIGQRYGATVKKYNMMNKLLKGLENDPYSRRHLLNLYQYADFEETDGLYPCFFMAMFSVSHRGDSDEMYLDMTLTSRANDYLTAGFINRMQYLALQMMVAKHLSMKVGTFNILVQSLHIYDKHIEQAEETIKRLQELKQRDVQSKPKLVLNVENGTDFYSITAEDFELVDYNPIKPQMSFEVAI